MIHVEVAYATPKKQTILTVRVLPNATIEDAIIQSGMMKEFPDIDLQHIAVGIFSKKATLMTRLKENDRVEIYRPLVIDPMEARRKRTRA
jgi:putative ubiquitin-RnfH superfamily antitoxin RatB of RatAB toxin-antitoxin module